MKTPQRALSILVPSLALAFAIGIARADDLLPPVGLLGGDAAGGTQTAAATPDDDVSADPQGVCIESGGGEVPTPHGHGVTLARYELANGEVYVLVGQVIPAPGQPAAFLYRIDLEEQPWLANANRVKSPVYPLLSGTPEFWKRFVGTRVRLKVRATGRIRVVAPSTPAEPGAADDGGPVYEIGLDPVAGPCALPLKK